jgi:trigger factor
MKVETQSAGPCRVRLVVKAEAAETRKDFDEIIGAYLKASRIPGFRVGKAPLSAVERHYRREIDGDVRSRLVGKFSRLALEEAKIAMVSVVNLTDVIHSPETGISFVLIVDVAPEFKLPKYHKIPLKTESVAVNEDEVDAQVTRLRNAISQFNEAADTALEEGDLACIDYTAVCDGKPLKDVTGDCANLGEGTKQWVQVAEPEFIPGLALTLKGLKAGDTKTTKIKFDKEFHVEAVRGLKVEYRIAVGAVRRRVLPTDEELCKRLNMETLDVLRTRIRQEALTAAQAREQSRQQQEVIEYLLRKTDFDLPQSQVAEETQHTVRSMLQDIMKQGGKREDIEKNRDSILENAANASKDRIRVRYILARIAEEEKIEVADAEVDVRLRDLAQRHRMSVEDLRADIEKRHGIETLRADIRAEKALERVVADAKTK